MASVSRDTFPQHYQDGFTPTAVQPGRQEHLSYATKYDTELRLNKVKPCMKLAKTNGRMIPLHHLQETWQNKTKKPNLIFFQRKYHVFPWNTFFPLRSCSLHPNLERNNLADTGNLTLFHFSSTWKGQWESWSHSVSIFSASYSLPLFQYHGFVCQTWRTWGSKIPLMAEKECTMFFL